MKAAVVSKLSSLVKADEMLTSSESKKVITLTGKTKANVSRYSLEPDFDDKPLYKAEVIINRFLNEN